MRNIEIKISCKMICLKNDILAFTRVLKFCDQMPSFKRLRISLKIILTK